MKRGFTLIELLLYIALITILMGALVPLSWTALTMATKNATINSVQTDARFITSRLAYEIRNASGINTLTASSISLISTVPANNPTVITFSGSTITIQRNSGSVSQLNSTETVISNGTFTNYTSADSKTKHIGYQFTISASNNSSRQEFKRSMDITGNAEIRSN